MPFTSGMSTKRLKTDPALECRLCRKDGSYMVCGNAAMEVALSATRCAATRFQMQAAINTGRPLPFPTTAERICLLGAYNSLVSRGYLNPHR